jgi:asparagine synthase (glutamine-hydrolysing)
MCGITGLVALAGAAPPDEALLRAMCRTLTHRGPDDEGVRIAGRTGLAMRRLAIIDIEGGAQPMTSPDGAVSVVCNGEIYNFVELRRELEALGHAFATRSDTEVIVHAYVQWGEACLTRLDGMFGLAILDERRGRLLLARDPIGVKPLYWARTGRHLVFGSEIRAILASGVVPRELDLDGVGELMTWEYVPGEGTLLRGVQKLGAGCALHLDLGSGSHQLRRYWDVPEGPEESGRSDAEWLGLLEETVDRCVRRQLVSDVPLGAFLSGGVDSSLVVSAMDGAHAFGIGFEDPSYDELPWARRVARHLDVELTEETLRPRVGELFERLVEHFDDPIGDTSTFATYLVAQLARRHVTVVLSGDGGDELFGGYESYVAQAWGRLYRRIPGFLRRRVIAPAVLALPPRPAKKGLVNKARRFVEGAALPEALAHARWRCFVANGLREALFTPEALEATRRPAGAHVLELFERAGPRDAVNRGLYVDLRSYLCDDILTKVDRTSMAVSLEARVPLLDPELVSLAFRIPGHLKVARGRTKILLKRLAATRVPPECVYRPKEGFSTPIKHWLDAELGPRVDGLLDTGRLREQGIFQPALVERLRAEHRSGKANHSHVLWTLVVFQAWAERWLAGGP